jgi:hypothetical protein
LVANLLLREENDRCTGTQGRLSHKLFLLQEDDDMCTGTRSHKLFLLQEDDDLCTGTRSHKLFLLKEDDDLCTGTRFNLGSRFLVANLLLREENDRCVD